jgi:FkbM family methyltransferase
MLSVHTRRLLSNAKRRTLTGAATIAAYLLRHLPARLQIGIRERLVLTKNLDYAAAPVALFVDSEIELGTRTRSCAKEPETVAWIESLIKPGDVVLDIGANVGAYSLVIAKRLPRQCRVFAFEPSYANFVQLNRNILLNDCSNEIVPLSIALSDTTELTTFHLRSTAPGAALHSLGDGGPESVAHGATLSALAFRLDDFLALFGLPTPHHLKIDVDGAELRVLRGAPRVLMNPALRSVLVEVDSGTADAPAVLDVLTAAGLSLRSRHEHAGSTVANCVFTRRR